MTDNMRQGAGDKLASSVKPDSEKSTIEQGTDKLKGAGDSVAGTLQPEGEKGAGQKVTDTVSGGSNDAQKQGGSMLDSASQMAGNAAKSVQDTLGMGGQSK